MPSNKLYKFVNEGTSFESAKAAQMRTIYFPLCGVDGSGIKSSITPFLGGDIKIDKNRYLTKPVSVEDLRQSQRNFFCYLGKKGVVSFADQGDKSSRVEAGLLWHKVIRDFSKTGLTLEALNFVPVTGESVELMRITVTNTSKEALSITPTFHMPIFARALANKHDHEHVTSLLNRTKQLKNGVSVEPTMVFDERGHETGEHIYFVLGKEGNGNDPAGTFPTLEQFYGDSGDIRAPEAVVNNLTPSTLSTEAIEGKEAAGAIRFKECKLAAGKSKEYLIVMGIADAGNDIQKIFKKFETPELFDQAISKNEVYWQDKVDAIRLTTGNSKYDSWMRWVTVQPVLRRIFGCSFLPDHDYGKGGRGWRDIWQDLLSLNLIEPENMRGELVNNFAGVRIDGSNATIIGSAPGEFIADRNAITRVWMDHGVWPLCTLLLYINQTGDYGVLLEECPYFRDVQLSRTFEKDYDWTPENGNFLTDSNVKTYRGTLIEHVLVEHLVQFFNVGEHNITRLEDADWNDGLDMAKERGESVTFMSFYGGNLLAMADLLEDFAKERGITELTIATEIKTLMDTLTKSPVDYNDVTAKQAFLFEQYFPSVQPEISGVREKVSVDDVICDLRSKGEWIFNHIRNQEFIEAGKVKFFNGYYDNTGARVEGEADGLLRMTLVGQVFPVMSGLANEHEIAEVVKSVKKYLVDKKLGGYRLNTDFKVPHYADLGRAFGFAYGTKENGAFFSHMIVMFAYALYSRGFVREGYDVLQSVYGMCADTDKSKIYPGVPEYFDSNGRGFYHYLTGAGSWMVYTKLTEVFGVKGFRGDLILQPKLVKEQFEAKSKTATAQCGFAGKNLCVAYENSKGLDFGAYQIEAVFLNDEPVSFEREEPGAVRIARGCIEEGASVCNLKVVLK